MVLGTVKLKHRKSTMWPTTRGRDVSNEITKEFTIVSFVTQYIVIRNSKIGWTEEKCIEMDKLAQENYTCCPSSEEYLRYQKHWYLTLNKSCKNAPMRLRSDFRAAVTIMNRLHWESGEEGAEPIPFQQYQRWHPSSSSSSSWWNWDTSKSWWSWWEEFIFEIVCCSRFRLQLMAICCNRREV